MIKHKLALKRDQSFAFAHTGVRKTTTTLYTGCT